MEINSNLDPNIFLNANQALNRISTGSQINSASDDPSGLALQSELQVQASGYSQAVENSTSAVALTQIADGALTGQSNILDDVRQNLMQAATDTTSQEGREALLQDTQNLLSQFDQIASQTNYNENTLLQNSSDDQAGSQLLQLQISDESGDPLEMENIQSNTQGMGLTNLLNQDPATFDAQTARGYLEDIDSAVNNLNDIRGEFGAIQNQVESNTRNMLTQTTSTLGADTSGTDYAQEVSNFSKQNILAQIGALGAAQSNNINQQTVARLLS